MEEKKKSLDWYLLARVLALSLPYKKLLWVAVFLAVILAPLTNIRPYLIKVMYDDYIIKNDMEGLKVIALLFIVIVLIVGPLRYLFIYITSLLGQYVVQDLRNNVFKHISELQLNYFDTTAVGQSTTRTINDVEAINTVFTQGSFTIIADLLGLFAVIGIMFYTSWRLALICLLVMPFLIIATYVFKEKVKVAFQRVRTQISKMNAFLQERISGMREIQILNAEKREMEKFKVINRSYTQANLNSILYYAIFFPVVELCSSIAFALLIWYGASSYLQGNVSFGSLIAFPMFLSMLFRPIRLMADKFNTLQMGLVASGRVFDVLDNKNKISNYGSLEKEKMEGEVQFENVSFAYDDENFVLKNISFHLNPGETVAIVGSTGSGKTTIINLINRLYEVKQGSIKIDGVDIKKFELHNLRSRISMVLQDVFLFNGTVMDNIRLRNDNITKEEIIEASKMIGAHSYILQLPNAYDFVLSERGSNLSVGQRQLISFVRALVFNPDVLILDEATSSIDTETELTIQYAIEKLIQKRSSIIIAHRLSTIRHADKILVLEKGEIVESGDHNSLLQKKNGRYKDLYEMQFLEMSNES